MHRKRRRIQYYSGEPTLARLRDKTWFPLAILIAAALVLAIIVGSILGGIADRAQISGFEHKDLLDFGGVDKPEEKFGTLKRFTGDTVDLWGMAEGDFRRAISDLPEGNAVGVLLYDGEGGVYFDTDLIEKGEASLQVKAPITAEEIADTAKAKDRYSIGVFVTGAFRESDEQIRILRISQEIALLSELASAGIRQLLIVGFPTDSDDVSAVNSYVRQAREFCGNVTLGVAISSEDASSSGIARLVACTEEYVDSYMIDMRDVSADQLGGHIERNAYFLTAYNMRLMLAGAERETLVSVAEQYGVKSYLIGE